MKLFSIAMMVLGLFVLCVNGSDLMGITPPPTSMDEYFRIYTLDKITGVLSALAFLGSTVLMYLRADGK